MGIKVSRSTSSTSTADESAHILGGGRLPMED